MKDNKAYQYCKENIKKKTCPKYVKLQMQDFMKICEGKNKKYIISKKKVKQIENILKLLIMPKGLKAGKTLYECTTGYQWLFYIAILCTVYKDNPKKRRYETGVLEICRKNFKTYTISTIFIILFLTEPKFSKFYSVAPDGTLSKEVREAISETIRSSPLIYEYKEDKRFKILRDYILFKPTQTQYIPLSYSTSRMDGRLPNAFICDEAGALPYECTTGYQWLFYIAILCTVYKDNPKKRRYETGVLEICRKNFKTYTISTIFIILFLTEPKFSKFYSVAPDGTLSKEVREAISETIRSSPLIYEYKEDKRFKILRDYILFKPTQTQYIPLSYSTSRMDGRLPNAFICDEAGALPISYPIEAMQSGQLNILNKLGFIISTKYPTTDNPMEEEVTYSKKVLDGIEKDETRFSLLYEPDKIEGWETDDLILKQSNPVALEIPEIWEDLVKKRALAIAIESKRENFVTKHCNIIYQGVGTETYIDVKDVQECKVANIDWQGRVVYLGVDLSETTDNTSVAMLAVDEDDKILCESFAFIPEGRITEKMVSEKVDYQNLVKTKNVIACGDRVIDYGVVEEFILSLEEKYGVHIQAIGYDRRNAMSTAQKLQNAGHNVVEIRQHSSVLHSPTKLLKEKILKKEFEYTKNKLLEINFQNAKCTYDTNKNMYVTKKKSRGKVDMVVSIINAMYLVEQDYFLNQTDFVIQVL